MRGRMQLKALSQAFGWTAALLPCSFLTTRGRMTTGRSGRSATQSAAELER